ncbi:hypothetical protein ZYGR_0AG00340 [Zygosaccharomyces rouxii]|uniref:Xaa-Pro aminopeptidase n=1 Tax=Zygosaccharomyces rouxii TaxID=4956 RepID=A0A1Q3A8Z3_ZYGRO|nr:hypothetical protein ZYGR_0AG00340 [Zygosaccharomyces rouxii]
MSARSANLNPKPSMQSLAPGTSRGTPGLTTHTVQGRPFRPCADCTYSPGLLSRQGKRSSIFLRRLENNRRRASRDISASMAGGSAQESVYSSDSLCQSAREVNTTERLLALRREMVRHELCCYIVPSEDEHQSEYVSSADQRRAFISGFNGSAGIACITRDLLNFNTEQPEGRSILSTDGRYFNQASQELDYNWSLVRQGEDPFTWQDWCIREAAEMSRGLGGKTAKVGVDPRLVSHEMVVAFNRLIAQKAGEGADVQLVPVEKNLIDVIWPQFEKPPKKELRSVDVLSEDQSGESFKSKRSRLQKHLTKNYGDNGPLAIVALDEICWFLNLRGSDIAYNPVFFAYVIVDHDSVTLFTDNALPTEVQRYCAENEVQLESYDQFWNRLSEKSQKLDRQQRFLIPDNASWQLVRHVHSNYRSVHSPIDIFKSVKNETEVRNARRAQVKDAVSLAQYFAWLEDQLINRGALIDEYRAAQKLKEIRRTQKNYKGDSFETISSTGANAAVIHYAPPQEGSSMINPDKVYLCDSGAQYLEGTTDITRTVHCGNPSQEQKDRYTLVLKGHLALERLVFPEGTTGFHIDSIARQPLWSQGLDYRHGTGHGIGSFLNVHEGPMGIGLRPSLLKHPLQSGNIISNEPGYYKDGEYGFRIESDMLVTHSGLKFGEKRFLQFENLTLVPYCRKLINVKMLTKEERQQINDYHSRIWNNIVQFTQPQSITYKWLKRETSEL